MYLFYRRVCIIFFRFRRCVDSVKNSIYVELANELEITKAITYLKMKDFSKVTYDILGNF